MKTLLIGPLLFTFSFLIAQPDTLRLKAEMKIGQPGYTGFSAIATFTNMSESNPWKKTEQKITGVPGDWNDYYRDDIWFQEEQFAYQNYRAGNMDSARFAGLMKSWKFDTADGFSADWIACHTTLVFRQAQSGEIEYLIDTDADYDFSDEKIQQPIENISYSNIDSLIADAQWLRYELWLDGRLVKDSVPILVKRDSMALAGLFLGYYMPLYAEINTGTEKLIINSMRPDFKSFSVSNYKDLDPKAETHVGAKLEQNHRLKLNDTWYRIEDFNRGSQELVLSEVDIEHDSIYPQVGFHAPDFTLTNLETSEEFSLADFKGKYVLLDFWGTWCRGCILGIPDLVDMYNELIPGNFEIVSVAFASSKEQIKKFKEEKGMNWIHSMKLAKTGIISDYIVEAYPTFVLIDPKGKILGRNLTHKKVIEIVRSEKN